MGAHVVNQLLAQGTRVRAALRSASSETGLRQRFAEEIASGALSFALVPDMAEEGAFDEAVKGVTGIIHCAYPPPDRFEGDVYQDMIVPAIKRTTSIMYSAAKERSIKSFVLTTGASNHTDTMGPNKKRVTDTTWNPLTLEQAEHSGNSITVFMVGKLHAERAAWELVKELENPFRFATVAPAYCAGPTLLPTQHVAQSTRNILWSSAHGNFYSSDGMTPMPWSHVELVALAHIRALDEPLADGKRHLIASNDSKSMVSGRDIAKLARDYIDPTLNQAPEPSNTEEHERYELYICENVRHGLGIKGTGIMQIVRDVVACGMEQCNAGIIEAPTATSFLPSLSSSSSSFTAS